MPLLSCLLISRMRCPETALDGLGILSTSQMSHLVNPRASWFASSCPPPRFRIRTISRGPA
eukprot:853330-Pyramimonas_sp.AAC.1